MPRALIPGSFDPATLGHLDIIRRASAAFDGVTVLVMQNSKKTPLFSLSERADILTEMTAGLPGVSVDLSDGLCADYMKKHGVGVIVKGIRSEADLGYELEIAAVNRMLCGAETLFLPSLPEFSHISTSVGLHLFSMGADVSAFFPPCVIRRLKTRI